MEGMMTINQSINQSSNQSIPDPIIPCNQTGMMYNNEANNGVQMALTARDNNGGDSIGAGYGISIWDGDTLVDSLYFEHEEYPSWSGVYAFLNKYKPVSVEDTANPDEIYTNWEDYVHDMEDCYG